MSEHVCVGRIKNEPGTKILGVSGLLGDKRSGSTFVLKNPSIM